MAPLLHLLVALGVIGLNEAGAVPSLISPAATLSLAIVPGILRWVAIWLGTRGRFRSAAVAARGISLWPPLAFAFAVLELGWHSAVLRWSGVSGVLLDWPHPALLLSLAPLALYELAAILARAQLADRRPGEVAQRVRFQVRQLFATTFPIFFFVGAGALVSTSPALRASIEEVGLYGAATLLLTLFILAAVLPFLLAWMWNTVPLSSSEYPWQSPLLRRVADESGLRYREIRVWRTGNLVANAAVVGFAPFHRFVLFTDLLLGQLGPRELVAVFGHESGHARRRHVALFASWALGFLLVSDWALQRFGPHNESLALGAFGLVLVAGALGFGALSRRVELDADLAAYELTGDPEGLARAVYLVGGASAKRSTWRHFSVEARVAFLTRVVTNPAVGKALRARLRLAAFFGGALLAAGVVAQGWGLVEDLNEDRLRADLRLGHYESAIARSAGAADLDPWLVGLAELAASESGGDGANGEYWSRRAGAALEQGRDEEAKSFLYLADLRGRTDMEPLLEAHVGGDSGRTAAELNALEQARQGAGSP